MDVEAGVWSARLDIQGESSAWLLKSGGQRLTIETFDANSHREAEMYVWYKSARLFMKDAKGLLNEHAFAAEYVKGSIRMTGDREKAQALTKVMQTLAPKLRRIVREAAGGDEEEGDDDGPGRLYMLLVSVLMLTYKVFSAVPGLGRCVHSVYAAGQWARRRRRRAEGAARLVYRGGGAPNGEHGGPSTVHPPTAELLKPGALRSSDADAGDSSGRGGAADDDLDSEGSDESTVSQALARLPWYERHLGTDLLLSSWLWLVGCIAYAVNSGAELSEEPRSAILWCDFVSAVVFVVGCLVLLYSAYPEYLLQIADALSKPPRPCA